MSEPASGTPPKSSAAASRSHRIRLHAAWTRHDGDCDSPADTLKVSLPDESLGVSTATTVTFIRRFNRPTGLLPHSVVMLESGWLCLASAVSLNGHHFECRGPDRWDITDLLRPHNRLEVTIASSRFGDAAAATVQISITDRD